MSRFVRWVDTRSNNRANVSPGVRRVPKKEEDRYHGRGDTRLKIRGRVETRRWGIRISMKSLRLCLVVKKKKKNKKRKRNQKGYYSLNLTFVIIVIIVGHPPREERFLSRTPPLRIPSFSTFLRIIFFYTWLRTDGFVEKNESKKKKKKKLRENEQEKERRYPDSRRRKKKIKESKIPYNTLTTRVCVSYISSSKI